MFTHGEDENLHITCLPNSHSSSLNQISLSSNYKSYPVVARLCENSFSAPPVCLTSWCLTQPSRILSHCYNPFYAQPHFLSTLQSFCSVFGSSSGREKRAASQLWNMYLEESLVGKKYLWLWESKGSLSSFYMTLHMAVRWDLGISLAHLKSVCLLALDLRTLPYLTFETLPNLFNISLPPCPDPEYGDKMQQRLVSVGQTKWYARCLA